MNWIGRFFVAMRAAEERKGVVPAARRRDQFPVGMRVLAVDDDPVCLKVLETLLLRCQYHGKYFFFSFCSSVLVFFFCLGTAISILTSFIVRCLYVCSSEFCLMLYVYSIKYFMKLSYTIYAACSYRDV